MINRRLSLRSQLCAAITLLADGSLAERALSRAFQTLLLPYLGKSTLARSVNLAPHGREKLYRRSHAATATRRSGSAM